MPPSRRKRRSESARYYIGVDGGGTKTKAVVVNGDNVVIGDGSSGPSNPLRVGPETAIENIAKAVNGALDRPNLSLNEITAAAFGLAGVRRGDLRRTIRDGFIKRFRLRKLEVVTDAEIAWYATTLGKPGLVVIAGTGSVCFGRNARGKTAIAGGWGPLAGDEGGGVGIARQALQAVAKASDGRGIATTLTRAASEYFRAAGPDNLIVAIYSPQVDNLRIAGFAKYVVESAQKGDAVARGILVEGGSELGLAACAVINELKLNKSEFPIGCVGSIFNAGKLLTEPLIKTVHTIAPRAFLTEPLMSPAQAAATMAMMNSNSK